MSGKEIRQWDPEVAQKQLRMTAEASGCTVENVLEDIMKKMGDDSISATGSRNQLKRDKLSINNWKQREMFMDILEDYGCKFPTRIHEQMSAEDVRVNLPDFCVQKVTEAYDKVCEYLIDAYNGERTLLFTKDYRKLSFYFDLYKPCLPNYVCIHILDFFKEKKEEMIRQVQEDGFIIYDDLEFGYYDSSGEEILLDEKNFMLSQEDKHKDRIKLFLFEFQVFWSLVVERTFPEGRGKATEYIEKMYNTE